ncbi:MAG: GAF domain-containing protein, partial [Cyclobacteriaceae bacterium]|nr:GAF domain-containing protein [Cyclobacteriaceae bacterium]
DVQEHYLNNKIKISNQVALLMACVGLTYSVFSIVFYPSLTIYPVFCIVFSFSAIALNYFGLHIISRFLLSALVLLLAFLYHGFLVQPGEDMITSMYMIEFSLTIIPWVLIDFREKPLLIASLAACYTLIFSQSWANDVLAMELDSSLFRSGFLSISSYAFSVVIAISCLLFMQNKNYSSEMNNEKLLLDINESKAEMEKHQTELQKNMEEINVSRKLEEKQNWVSKGIAEISDILRREDDAQVYSNLLMAIVKYIKANQGGIYLLNEDDADESYLELTSCYAFDRKKYQNKRIEIGQGLIGQCYLEKEPVILKEVPEAYVTITSGLGEAPPTFIAIIPIMQENKIAGVMEFA